MAKKTTKKSTTTPAAKKKAVKKKTPVKKSIAAKKTVKSSDSVNPKSAQKPAGSNTLVNQDLSLEAVFRSLCSYLFDTIKLNLINVFIFNPFDKEWLLSQIADSEGNVWFSDTSTADPGSIQVSKNVREASKCYEKIPFELYEIKEKINPVKTSETQPGFVIPVEFSGHSGLIAFAAAKCLEKDRKAAESMSHILRHIIVLTSYSFRLDRSQTIDKANKENISNLQKSYDTLSKKLADTEKENENQLSTQKKSELQFIEINKEVDILKSDISEKQKEIKVLTNELVQLKNLHSETASGLSDREYNIQRLSEEKEILEKQLAELREIIKNLEQSIDASEKKRLEDEKRITEKFQEENELLRQINEEETEKLTEAHEAKIAGLSEEIAILSEKNSIIPDLNKQIETLHNDTKKLTESLNLSRTELINQKENLTAEWSKRYNNLDEDLKNTKSNLENLRNTSSRLEEELKKKNQEISELEEMVLSNETLIEKQKASISGHEAVLSGIKQDYETTIQKLNSTISEMEARFETNENNFHKEIYKLKESETHLTKSLAASEEEILLLQKNTVSLEKEFEKERNEQILLHEEKITELSREIASLKDEKNAIHSKWESILKEKENSLEKLHSKVSEKDQEISRLNTKIQNLNQELNTSRRSLGEAEQRENTLKIEKKDLLAMETLLKEELTQKERSILSKNSTIEDLNKQKDALNKEISAHREHITRNELKIKDLESEKSKISAEKSSLTQELKEAEIQIQTLNDSIQTKKTEIENLDQKLNKRSEELSAALLREKGSKEEGKLIEGIIKNLANIKDFSDMLNYIQESLAEKCPFERGTLFSKMDENKFTVEGHTDANSQSGNLIGNSILMRDTLFGEAVASQSLKILSQPEKDAAVDLPFPEIPAWTKGSCAVIPLYIEDKITGILTIASQKENAFTDKNTRLLISLSPLLARTILFKINQENKSRAEESVIKNISVRKFIESHFIDLISQNNTLRQIISEKDETFPKRDTGIDSLPVGRSSAEQLTAWTVKLTEMIRKNLDASVELQMETEILDELKSKYNADLNNIFWFLAEACDNIVRHSEATQVSFISEKTDNGIKISVEDNGQGLMRTAGTENPVKGRGFQAMKTFVEISGGKFLSQKGDQGYGLLLTAEWHT